MMRRVLKFNIGKQIDRSIDLSFLSNKLQTFKALAGCCLPLQGFCENGPAPNFCPLP
jgi:hypothetical protein